MPWNLSHYFSSYPFPPFLHFQGHSQAIYNATWKQIFSISSYKSRCWGNFIMEIRCGSSFSSLSHSFLSSYSLALCVKNLFFFVHIALLGLRVKTFYKEISSLPRRYKKYEKIRLRILCTSSSQTIGERKLINREKKVFHC